ncbi:MAG: ATP-binding cassette domain-containing protein [candidate division Zixibacteria bacterium]|nr:ATP-binding cassette domain-containing protein [candidate division Zixibacteria bacterium]
MSTSKNKIILETRDISHQIKANGNSKYTVKNFSYSFEKGNIYNIIGPSGAGKTSFLRLLNRLDDPSEGEIFYQDKPLKSYQPTRLRECISLIFQETYLFPGTVGSNLEYCISDCTPHEIKSYLEQVGLDSQFINKDVSELSVGEKQRVAIARSLVLKPEILLLDEPTASLDPTLSQTIEHLILSLINEYSLTAIMITHNPEQAKRMGGKTLLMVSGALVEDGETSELFTNPKTEQCKKYIRRELK